MNNRIERDRASICLAGFGHWGKNLARNFSQLGALTAICEKDESRHPAIATAYPGVRLFSDWREALSAPGINAVALATPAEQHHSMAIMALHAGKDVFVEKPLALDPDEGAEMIATADARGLVLMVGHLLRYHPAVRKIQQLIAAGELGKIEYIYSNRLSMGKIRAEENALWSFAPHDISVILALVGKMPVAATCTGGAYLQPNVADVTVSNLLFDNGCRSHIFVSWLHPYKEQRLVVIGNKKMVVFEDSRPDHKLVSYDKKIEMKNGNLEAGKAEATPIEFPADEPLQVECMHFIDAMLTRAVPATSGDEGLRVLQVLQACQRSLQMGGEPVQVSAASRQKVLAI